MDLIEDMARAIAETNEEEWSHLSDEVKDLYRREAGAALNVVCRHLGRSVAAAGLQPVAFLPGSPAASRPASRRS